MLNLIRSLLILFSFLILKTVNAQGENSRNYPKGYFRNPLNIPMNLSGNFGELRSNHYHMGLDLKTNARENLPVYAAAEGYISRVKIEPGGFGRAIYINHPNGYTTLYAHLNAFNQRLESWLKQQQYKLESWNVYLELTPDLFPVKKGDFLANSGNTGGSQGPHLHFEVRNTADDVNLNPLLFGFPVPDNIKPRILRLAVYDRSKSVYEKSPKIYSVKTIAAGRYSTTTPVITVNSALVSFAITSYDSHSGSANLNGIYGADLILNEEPVVKFRMDNISYNDTRYLNAHIDYKVKSAGGSYLQHLSELPGYINSIYQHENGNGVLDISDGEVHEIRIRSIDAAGNNSELKYKIRYVESTGIPERTSAGKMFYPLMIDGFESEDCEFYIGEKCLYDSVSVRYSNAPASNGAAVSAIHSIGTAGIPLQEAFLIRIKPGDSLTLQQKDRTVMQWYAGSRNAVQKVEWQQDWAAAYFRDFGSYQLLVDNDPPQIIPIGFADGSNLAKSTRIVFTVKENLGKFKNVRAELDGKWLRFTNDKGRNFIYQFDEKCSSGDHELTISAEDEAGNIATRTFKFRR